MMEKTKYVRPSMVKEASELTEKLSKHTLGGPLVLTGTDWQVTTGKTFSRSSPSSLND